ncbi:MAG TPA: hypothetical protein VIK55_08940 [Paludibacter sp.]
MKEPVNSIETLLTEFTNISVDINPKESWSDDIDHPIIDSESGSDIEYPKLWDFKLTFNSSYAVESDNPKYLEQEAIHDYSRFVSKAKLNAFLEIDGFVVSENSMLKKRNYLNTIKLKFEELLTNYHHISEEKYSEYYQLFSNKIINRSISENKIVHHLFEQRIINSFLIIQKETIDNLLTFIKEKNLLTFIKEKINILEQQPEINEVSELNATNHLNMMANNRKVKIKFLDDINVLSTLFYDLFTEGYLQTGKADLERFIITSFTDKDGSPLSEETIHTILKPGREDKRALADKKILVPKRK